MGSKKKQVIGYKYFLGMHLVICHGPVDSIQKIIVGDREAWSGNVTASGDITIAASELFGGAKKEGGVSGTVNVMMGELTQAKNTYLQSKIQTLIPAFRGVVSLVLKQCYVCAMSPYPKAWAIKVKRIPAKTWYAAKAEISGSANPVHVIYETLTNKDWGMGIDPALLNDTKFRDAADTCFTEGLGVSMMISNQDSIEKFIYEVLGHCNGMFFIEPATGKFAIKLLRDDYVVASLPVYNESNVVALESFDRPTYSEIVNEVVLSYRPQGGISDDTVTVQDLASIQAQGGIVSHSVTYPGIDTAANASRLAMRDLRQKSTPLARIKIKVNKTGWNLALGDVFKFSWAEHGLVDIVCRVMAINAGGLRTGEIIVECAEDIFGLPSTTYVGNQPNLWTDPIATPVQYTNRFVREASYFELNDILAPSSFTAMTATTAYLIANAGEMPQYSQGYELWTSAVAGTDKTLRDVAQATPYGLLSSNIGKTDTALTLTGFTSSVQIAQLGQYCYIDSEVVRLDAINFTTGAVTIGRGCLDTVPQTHNSGAFFLFSESARTFDTYEWASGGTIYARMCMRSSSGVFALASAADNSVVMVGRQAKPYAPGNFRVNTLQYPTDVTFPITLSWAHRDRTQQLTRPIIDTSAGNIGPEATVTYKVRVRPFGGSYTEYDVSGTSYVITSAGFTSPQVLEVEVESIKGTERSFQKHYHTFTATTA